MKDGIFWSEVGSGFGEPVPPRAKRQNNFSYINFKGLFKSQLSGIYIYLIMFLLFFHFSFNFKDLGDFNRATMRTKEFSAPLATASGPHASSLCLQTSQSIFGLIHHAQKFQNYRMIYFNNSHVNL